MGILTLAMAPLLPLSAASPLLAADSTAGCCDRFAMDRAAAILAVSPDDLLRSSHDLMISPEDQQNHVYQTTPCNCTIRSKSNFLRSISYVTYVYTDPGRACAEFNRMRENFATVAKVDPIAGIGDHAFWVGDSRFQRLVAIRGGVVVDVLSPKDFAAQQQTVRLVLERF